MNTKRKPILALDGDGIIFDWIGGFIGFALTKGFQLDLNSGFDTYNMSSWFLNMTNDQFVQMVELYNKAEHPKPYYNFLQNLIQLQQKFEVMVVSAYSSDPEARARRSNALVNLGLHNIFLLGIGESKQETLEEIGADIFVDDNPQHLLEGLAAGCLTYAIKYPYNTGVPNVVYIDDLVELMEVEV